MTGLAALPAALLLQAAQPDTVVTGFDFISATLTRIDIGALIRALLWLFVGIPLLLAITRWLKRWVTRQYSAQQAMVVGKLVTYPGVLLILVLTLMELGFNLSPLLGAAGVVGIAVGFASQTSVSNVISGFFLIGEKPFEVDDVIQVGETVGRVMSIDTLSVKLRTFDNRYIRIPNETIVKSQVTTVTRFPIRRLDMNIGVAYKEDIPRVREVLMDLARLNPRALMEPEPTVFFDGYGDSSLDLRLAVWTMRENFFSLKNTLLEEIKARFDSEGIEIPFPHHSLYTGEATRPFPIRIVPEADFGDAEAEAESEAAISGEADSGATDTPPYTAPPPAPADPLEDEPR
ncbi:mechanosensitive ion channel family protein [soil metagenome]